MALGLYAVIPEAPNQKVDEAFYIWGGKFAMAETDCIWEKYMSAIILFH